VTPEGREVAKASVPTRHLLGYIMRALSTLDVLKQTKFFTLISSYPGLRGAAGWCFEKLLVAHLSSMSLKATAAKKNAPCLVIPGCKRFYPLEGLPALACADSHLLPFCWRLGPILTRFTSLDAIICTKKEILLLHTGHEIKCEGIQQILAHLPKKFQWARCICLVFITNSEDAAVCLQNQHLPGLSSYNVQVYSSVLKISKVLDNRKAREALESLLVRHKLCVSVLYKADNDANLG
jgi:hypothetical protein